MATGFEEDPHSQAGNACPRNSLGITVYAELQPIETIFSLKRQEELLRQGISGKFDVAHLKRIHRYLFQDVFPWAGTFRVVNISKGDSHFGPARFIEGALFDALEKLRTEQFLQQLSPSVLAASTAYYLGEIDAIHPFREGNGRTQREFIRQLALQAEQPLSWAGFSQQQMVDASILSHTRGDNTALTAILSSALYSSRESAPEK